YENHIASSSAERREHIRSCREPVSTSPSHGLRRDRPAGAVAFYFPLTVTRLGSGPRPKTGNRPRAATQVTVEEEGDRGRGDASVSNTTSSIDGGTRKRDQFIPVRKSEIIPDLVQERALGAQAEDVRRFCRLRGSIYHFENFAELEQLRDDYFHFNPEIGTQSQLGPAALADKRRDLAQTLNAVLKKANYAEISHQEVEEAHNQRHL